MITLVIATCAFSFLASSADDAETSLNPEVKINPGKALKWSTPSSDGSEVRINPGKALKWSTPSSEGSEVGINPGKALKWSTKKTRKTKDSSASSVAKSGKVDSGGLSYEECMEVYDARSASLQIYDGFGAWKNPHAPINPPPSVEENDYGDSERRDLFNTIYEKNMWNWKGGMASGIGSSFEMAGNVWCTLERIVQEHKVTSICDAGVGDFRWMHLFLLEHSAVNHFVGMDISDVVVQALDQTFAGEVAQGRYKFLSADLVCGDQRLDINTDLVVLRDVLQHQRLHEAVEILRCIDESGAKLLLVSSYDAKCADVNRDLSPRGAALSSAHVALQVPPFHFPEPIARFPEYNHEESKSLLLYKLPLGISNFVDSDLMDRARRSRSSAHDEL